MRLANVLADLGADELERLTQEHVRPDEPMSRPTMLNLLEGVLRNYLFVHAFVQDRQPPAFSILTLLLGAPDFTLSTAGFREAVVEHSNRLCDLVTRGEIVGRDDQLRLYRRVLYEARRNDLVIDASENAILGVLRRELDIAQVEHFLIEHHAELQEFWNKDGSFLHEINNLRSGGLIFVRDGATILPEDVAPLVRQVLGIDMPRENARRLFSWLAAPELYDALAAGHVKTSGTKDERIERLLQNMVQPHTVLKHLSLATMKEVCRASGASVSGSKEELAERLVQHFASGRDLAPEEPMAEPIVEERALDETRFRLLFGSLRGTELSDILRSLPELRQSGSKDVRITTLWEAQRSETTLLDLLMSRDLEAVLARLDLRLSGSKGERVARIIDHFASVDPTSVHLAATSLAPLPSETPD